MRKIIGYFKNYRAQALLSPFFKLLEACFELTVPLIVAKIIDLGIATGDTSYIKSRVLVLCFFAVTGFCSAILAQYFAAYCAAGISSDIRSDLFRKIERLAPETFDGVGSSNVVTSLTSDVNQISSGINLFLRLLLRSPFIVIGATVMAFTISVRLALIFAVAISVLAVLIAFNMRMAIPAYKASREGLDALVRYTDNGLAGVRVVRSFNRTSDDYAGFESKSLLLNKLSKKAAGISAWLNPATFVIINLAICFLIYRGGVNVNSGSLTQGEVIALYNYMSQILVELIKLANLIVTVSRAVACAYRVESLLNLEEEKINDAVDVPESDKAGEIVFDNVGFIYKGNSEASLSDISFSVKPGQSVGIIGRTGCGKSTVALLMAGVYPATTGKVTINAADVDRISRNSLYSYVGLVLQKSRLFTGTLKENITLGRKIDDGSLAGAVRISCADDVVKAKSSGLESKVSGSGAGLSGGQRQRIGIARALAGNPRILILDDSTSALDAGTEKRLLDNLDKMPDKPTTVIVSQKIRSVMNCDNIILMEEGRIAASGTHEQLLESSEEYRYLVSLQTEAAK